MAKNSIIMISAMMFCFGSHGFDIMSKFRAPLLGFNVLLKDDSKCQERLIGASAGSKNAIPSLALSASSLPHNQDPHWGRLLSSKWWIPSVHDKYQWLKIDLKSLAVVRKSAVQGSGDSGKEGHRVISYFLYHSMDDALWYAALEKENPRLFVGNLNNSEVISNSSFPPFLTRYVKFCPQSWHIKIALRVELYGCKAEGMDAPMGMESKAIPDDAITASGVRSSAYHPSNARLNLGIGGGGWCAPPVKYIVLPIYLQVDLEKKWALTAVATQSLKDAFDRVATYHISTTYDHKTWVFVHDFTGKKLFIGNQAWRYAWTVRNHLPFFLWVHGVRLTVQQWSSTYCCARIELYGMDSLGTVSFPDDKALCGDNAQLLGSTVTPYIAKCFCSPGYMGDGFYCEDLDECSTGDNVCGAVNRQCSNTPGSFFCECPPGTARNGGKCEDIDECLKPRDVCPFLTVCVNTEGSFICDCKESGYLADGKQCLDVDECRIGSHKCGKNSTCVNALGSYTCFCNVGFTGWDSWDGKQQCSDVDECQVNPKQCGRNSKCVNTVGSYQCFCKEGFVAKGPECEDVDECASNSLKPCEGDSLCVNLPGSYACQCKLGYQLTDNLCQDVNECQQYLSECHHQADCYNTDGSYLCVCKKGFYGDGIFCSRNQQCLKEDQECNAALERAEKKTGVKSAALKMSSGQDVLKARKRLQTLFILVVLKMFI